MLVVHDANIYDKNNEKIGFVKKGVKLQLKSKKNLTLKNKYFEVSNGDFYVYYKDVEDDTKKKNSFNNYLVFNKNIVKNKVTMLMDGKESFSLSKKVSLPILYMDDKYYYVNYFDNLMQIKKSKDDKVVDSNNTDEQESSLVSVFDYEVGDCDNCISKNNVEEEFKYIKENNYNLLTIDEYNEWLKGNIRLKGNNILLTTDSKEKVDGLLYTLYRYGSDLKFNNNNKASTKEERNRYKVTNNTSMDIFKQMVEGKEIYDKKATKIAVLNYHFFFDSSLGESCNETICLEVSKFRQHLQYLKDNNFKTLTMKEVKQWMYGEIDLPEKSVLITVDDGAMGTGKHNGNKLNPLLEEYKMHATLFLIAGWWDIANYRSSYLDIQSHTYDMHLYGTCGKGQLVCANYEQAKADLKKSLDIIGDNTSFCFPFYNYSDTAIQAIKDLGFKLAFVGGSRKATRNSNKYLIPRYPIVSSITMEDFKQMVN